MEAQIEGALKPTRGSGMKVVQQVLAWRRGRNLACWTNVKLERSNGGALDVGPY